MSLYDTIAASHRGQCFALIGRRFGLDEVQVAETVYAMLRELAVSLDSAITDRSKLAGFLRDLGRGDYLRLLTDDSIFSDQALRDRGIDMLAKIGSVRTVQLDPIYHAVRVEGVDALTCKQMLPLVAMLMIAALRHKAERPLRRILAARRGERVARLVQDPFGALAESLVEPKRLPTAPRPAARLVGALLGRNAPPGYADRHRAAS